MQFKDMVPSDKAELFRKCADVGKRLIGKSIRYTEQKPIKRKEHSKDKPNKKEFDKDFFHNGLL